MKTILKLHIGFFLLYPSQIGGWMKITRIKFGFLFGLGILLSSCESDTTAIKIGTAANMQFAMEEIKLTFEKQYNTSVELIISSSGKLTAQIEQGAPFDVFVAANTKYPDYLYEKKLTSSPPNIYANGQLVLWTLNEIIPSVANLTSNSIRKIAIANPKTAPYGLATVNFLKKQGIYEQIKGKLVFAESISQVNQFVTTQSVDVGFTALSVVLSPKMKEKGAWTLIESKIPQAAVLLKNETNNEAANAFYAFLFSKKSKEILNKYGYTQTK